MPFEEDLPQNSFDDSGKAKPDAEDLLKAMDAPEPKNKPMPEIHLMLDYSRHLLADTSTRHQHLSDLLVQWEDTVAMMAERKFLGRDELFKKAGIELAIKQLKKTMEMFVDYGDVVDPIRRHINQVPKAFAIYGGRGTPLKPWEPGEEEKS